MGKLDVSDAKITPTAASILSKISEFDIFNEYCEGFSQIDKPFCSELRDDRNPGVSIYMNHNDSLRYKDFASGEHLDCFGYVMAKYGCTYHESLNIISNDFGLSSFKPTMANTGMVFVSNKIAEDHKTIKTKTNIEIVKQPFSIIDYDYWNQFGISLNLLHEYNVFSAKYVYITKNGKRTNLQYRNSNPCYAYMFTSYGETSYKIYRPLSKEGDIKWLFNGDSSINIEGYDQLPLHCDTLVITKSLKDCMSYRSLGISAISLQGEGNNLQQEFVTKLLKRFNRIIINYDNDAAGILGAKRIHDQYNFDRIFIDGAKDLSDYIKINGIVKAKEMINNKIK